MKRLFRMLMLLVIVAGLPFVALEIYLRIPVSHAPAVVTIESGTGMQQTARQLRAARVIRSVPAFLTYGRLRKLDRAIKAGEYEFESGLTLQQVFDKLISGAFRTFEIRLIEGWTYRQMADYLAKQSFVTDPDFAKKFIAACEDPARVAKLGVPAKSLEGFLFPNTYRIHRPRDPGMVVDLLVTEFQTRYRRDVPAQHNAGQFSKLALVTLASIIEKETGADAERPLVSAVFHNRLKKGMRLETDPTVVYGIPNYDGVIHRSDLDNPHPYNTYIHAGLPPGPIANPGLKSLQAAARPADVDYLYFVSKNDGTHVFSADYSVHSRAVQEYQR